MADPKGRIEELAQANLKLVPRDPCQLWDEMVEQRMVADGCDRSVAVDRCLSEREGSDLWRVCCAWDARQAKTIEQNGRQIKTGNWLELGNGAAPRRIPRAP